MIVAAVVTVALMAGCGRGSPTSTGNDASFPRCSLPPAMPPAAENVPDLYVLVLLFPLLAESLRPEQLDPGKWRGPASYRPRRGDPSHIRRPT
jgi:hypothetical protein